MNFFLIFFIFSKKMNFFLIFFWGWGVGVLGYRGQGNPKKPLMRREIRLFARKIGGQGFVKNYENLGVFCGGISRGGGYFHKNISKHTHHESGVFLIFKVIHFQEMWFSVNNKRGSSEFFCQKESFLSSHFTYV